MIKTAINATAPIFAVAGGEVYGINNSQLGTTLLIIMALAVILNQLWTLFEKARRAIRSPEADTSGLESACGRYRREIGRTLDNLEKEDRRQDQLNKDHFLSIEGAIRDLRDEMREENKGLRARSDELLVAVSNLDGKVNS